MEKHLKELADNPRAIEKLKYFLKNPHICEMDTVVDSRVFRFILLRIILTIFVLFGVTLITFFLSLSLPADPAMAYAGPGATPEMLEAIRKEYGLDRSFLEQYVLYMGRLFRGDLGISIRTRNPVSADLVAYLPATIELTLASLMLSIIFGILIGVVSAVKRDKKLDHILRILSISGVSLPAFFSGLVLLYFFYFILGWAPGGGRIDPQISLTKLTGLYLLDSLITLNVPAFLSSLHHIILPAISLALLSLSTIARTLRSSMLEALGQDYIKTAKAKGLSNSVVIMKHALKNALLPTITLIGMIFGNLLGGSILIEFIYRWPGLGYYITRAILTADFPAIMATTLLMCVIYVIVNTIVDILYGVIDPRASVVGRD